MLGVFSNVEASADYKGDFAKYISDRNMKDYNTALMWCRVFLMGKSFTSFAGSEIALALLFPMETLFENYVAAILKRNFPEVTLQFQFRTELIIYSMSLVRNF